MNPCNPNFVPASTGTSIIPPGPGDGFHYGFLGGNFEVKQIRERVEITLSGFFCAHQCKIKLRQQVAWRNRKVESRISTGTPRSVKISPVPLIVGSQT